MAESASVISTPRSLLAAYFRQQRDMGMPELLCITRTGIGRVAHGETPATVHQTTAASAPGTTHPAPTTFESRRKLLHELYHSVKTCGNCNLGALRHSFVFGAGNAAATLMVIGEAPNDEEDRSGLPFSGQAGELLTKMLGAIELDRTADVFCTNILKCRPPANREPQPGEAATCAMILQRQIDIIAPRAILVFGKTAAHHLLGSRESIANLRGITHHYRDIPVVVTYHPAVLLRSAHYKPAAWQDLKYLKQILNETGKHGSR